MISIYPEAQFDYDVSTEELYVQLPWASGSIYLPKCKAQDIRFGDLCEVANLLNNNMRLNIDELLSFPFAQFNARPMNSFAEFPLTTRVFSPETSLTDMLEFFHYPLSQRFAFWDKRSLEWQWNPVSFEQLCCLPTSEFYDPLSIYTQIRRLRNIPQARNSFSAQLNDELCMLAKTDEGKFFDLVLQLLTQAYYITLHCEESLYPAIAGCPFFADELKQYIKEEVGHHHLVARSLQALEVGLEEAVQFVFPETIVIMQLLRHAAQYYPVAFACLVGAFEQSAQYESDPLADLILKTSRPQVAKGIALHFRINKEGNHSEVGLSLCKKLPAYSYDELIAAIRISEMMSILFESTAFFVLQTLPIK